MQGGISLFFREEKINATNRSTNVKNFCLHKNYKFAIIRLQRGASIMKI